MVNKMAFVVVAFLSLESKDLNNVWLQRAFSKHLWQI